jgi:hypothetical protein
MTNIIVTTTLIVLLTVQNQIGAAAEQAWGAWEDEGGANLYEFLPNNQFRFSGVQKVWIKYRGIIPFSPSEGWARGRYISERTNLSGAWEAGPNICTAIDPSGVKVTGNLAIYVGSLECCMEAKRLGPTLVLRSLSVKGQGPDTCMNRTLRQQGENPESDSAQSGEPARDTTKESPSLSK